MGCRILLVEDEALVALNLEALLLGLGHEVVGVASSSVDALAVAAMTHPDMALVDCRLADGDTGVTLARYLTDLYGTLVVAVTADPGRVEGHDHSVRRVVAKPYTDETIIETLAWMAGQPTRTLQGADDFR